MPHNHVMFCECWCYCYLASRWHDTVQIPKYNSSTMAEPWFNNENGNWTTVHLPWKDYGNDVVVPWLFAPWYSSCQPVCQRKRRPLQVAYVWKNHMVETWLKYGTARVQSTVLLRFLLAVRAERRLRSVTAALHKLFLNSVPVRPAFIRLSIRPIYITLH